MPEAAVPAMEISMKVVMKASTTTTAIGRRRPKEKMTKFMMHQIIVINPINRPRQAHLDE
jgi:hypothetical protein